MTAIGCGRSVISVSTLFSERQARTYVQFIKGDIKSGDLLFYVLETEKIDTIMHFAAQTHVDHSFGNSVSFTMNNMYVYQVSVDPNPVWLL